MTEYAIRHVRLYKVLDTTSRMFNYAGLVLFYGSFFWIGIFEGFVAGFRYGLVAGFGSLFLVSTFLFSSLNFSIIGNGGKFLFYGLLSFAIYASTILLIFDNNFLHSLKISVLGTVITSLVAFLFSSASAICTPPRPEYFTICQECKRLAEAWHCHECSTFVCFEDKCRSTHIHNKHISKQS